MKGFVDHTVNQVLLRFLNYSVNPIMLFQVQMLLSVNEIGE